MAMQKLKHSLLVGFGFKRLEDGEDDDENRLVTLFYYYRLNLDEKSDNS